MCSFGFDSGSIPRNGLDETLMICKKLFFPLPSPRQGTPEVGDAEFTERVLERGGFMQAMYIELVLLSAFQ